MTVTLIKEKGTRLTASDKRLLGLRAKRLTVPFPGVRRFKLRLCRRAFFIGIAIR